MNRSGRAPEHDLTSTQTPMNESPPPPSHATDGADREVHPPAAGREPVGVRNVADPRVYRVLTDPIVRRARPVTAVLLAFLAFAVSLVVEWLLLPYGSGNNDGAVYRFQAELYRHGSISLPADLPDAFRPWMSGLHDGRRVMVFPLGWPGVLAVLRSVSGSYAIAVALVAAGVAVASWWAALEITGDRLAAAAGGALLVLSPLFVVHSGVPLSYLPALGCQFVVLAGFRRAARSGAAPPAVVAGLAAGSLFAMRPFDATLLALPYLVYVLALTGNDRPRRVRLMVAGALGALPAIAATATYNTAVTGHPIRFPIAVNGGDNRFGVGARQLAEGSPVVDVTLRKLGVSTLENLAALPQWLPGGYASLALMLGGAVLLWRVDRTTTLLFAAIAVMIPAGYVSYWGTLLVAQGNDHQGPFYYTSLWAPATVLAGIAGAHLCRRGRTRQLGFASVVLLAVALALLGPVGRYREFTAGVQREVDAIATAPVGSVVVLPAERDGPWVLQPRGYFSNDPDLRAPVIYAAYTGRRLVADLDRVPGRPIYSMQYRIEPGDDLLRPTPVLTRLERRSAPVLAAVQRIGPGSGDSVAYAATPQSSWRCRPERDTVTWIVRNGAVVSAKGCTGLEAAPPPGNPVTETLTVGHLRVDASNAVRSGHEERFTLHVDDGRTTALVPGRGLRRIAGNDGRAAWFRDDRPDDNPVEVRPATEAEATASS
jgi:hypothetical protein